MTKNVPTTSREEALAMSKREISVIGSSEMAAMLADIGYQDTITREDIAIPIIKIVQKGSDSILDENEDARPGMLYNTATCELMGNDITFIPCSFEGKYVKRVPMEKGGGFSGVFLEKPEGFDEQFEGKWISKKEPDVEVIYTHYHAVLVLSLSNKLEKAIIPLNSTQMKISKKWNISFRKRLVGVEPIFMSVYHAKVTDQISRNFNFKGWSSVSFVRSSTLNEIKEAAEFYKFIRKTDMVTKSANTAEYTDV